MPRYTTSQTYTDGNTQIVALPDSYSSTPQNAIVVKSGDSVAVEDEEYAEKLARISEMVPLRIDNTMGSSAGSGSGDFHMYRKMRRHEQDRVMRMEIDYQKRMEEKTFQERREQRLKEDEEKTAKRRAKRQKKKDKKKQKKSEPSNGRLETIQEEGQEKDSSEEEEEEPVQATLD